MKSSKERANYVVNMGSNSRNMACLLVNSDMSVGFVIRRSPVRSRRVAPETPLECVGGEVLAAPQNPNKQNQTVSFRGQSGVHALEALGWERRPYLSYRFLADMFQPSAKGMDEDRWDVEHIRKRLRDGRLRCLVGSISRVEKPRPGQIRKGGNESENHLWVKAAGLAFLRSLGFADAECEACSDNRRFDVYSEVGGVAVEVGNTKPQRAIWLCCEVPSAMIVLPYSAKGDRQPAICFLSTPTGMVDAAFRADEDQARCDDAISSLCYRVPAPAESRTA